ncbi:MAG: cytochrome D ubiquinol oxidase subunit I [Deltaproteobacteria bacterium RBG_16_49_23]|nr:MAG: cytochrome D ubiquinol oxidase subunit I [Deltaproteobacteria bacterium RBG_16_49_23]
MDAIFLARLQFGVTICFHFLFPPVTIGLGCLLCIVEWRGWKKNDEVYVQMGNLFGKLFAITFAVGIASGIVMLFQFGTNWAPYSNFVANVFGAPLAAEGFFAFFLESTFMGLYLFGRGRVSKGLHWFSLFMVSLAAATVSAFFIIAANSWQQTPAGYVLRDGRAELANLFEAIFNPSTLPRYFHVIVAALTSGAFIFASVGAWHVLKDKGSLVGRKALFLGVVFGLFFSCIVVMPFGHMHAQQVARTQPEKFAAIEGLYIGQRAAPLVLFAIPFTDPLPPQLKTKVEIPGLLSYLAFGNVDAHVQGINQFPRENWPPLFITFVSFHTMTALGFFFIALMGLAAYRLIRGRLYEDRWLLKVLVWSVPLPLLAIQLGWITAEVGRQPWIVYKLLRTSEGASPTVSAQEIGFSLTLFSVIYMALLAAWLFLMIRKAKEEPKAAKGLE